MTAKEMIEIVNDVHGWGGNTFTLAMLVMQRQREDDAAIADAHGSPEIAEAIRASV